MFDILLKTFHFVALKCLWKKKLGMKLDAIEKEIRTAAHIKYDRGALLDNANEYKFDESKSREEFAYDAVMNPVKR